MTEMQAAEAAVPPPTAAMLAVDDDFDFALGCECADPALQIDDWGLHGLPSGGEPS